jgi:hypothetical protein
VVWLLALLVFGLALAPRVLAPGDFLTADEADHWQQRSISFLQAVQAGDFAATNLTEHPGVTTMWLGAAGTRLYAELEQRGEVAPIAPVFAAIEEGDYGAAARLYHAHPDDYATYRWLVRLPLALVNALGVALLFVLAWRLFGAGVGLLAALFLAADPFLVAHAKVLHVDALLTTFMSLSLLAALLAVRLDAPPEAHHGAAVRLPWLLASAVAAGLALLTKAPAVLLVPLVGLVLVAGLARPPFRAVGPLLAALLIWGIVALVVWAALWPALWVNPLGTIQTIVRDTLANSGAPHGNGNYFLGRVVGDPGPLFYPLVLALRLTPWTLAGLLALAAAVPHGPRSERRSNAAVVLLVLFVLLFTLALSIPAKKFDRYLLPVFPALNILAALGWVRLLARLPLSARARRLAPLGYGLVGLGLFANLLWYHPYELAYYNPLLGGGPTAERTMYVGWGEGLAQAGDYITAQPNGCDHAISSWYQRTILPYVCTPVMHPGWATQPGGVDYAVFYVNQIQRDIDRPALESVRARGTLVHTVHIHGIDYARIYQLPRPTEHASGAEFGAAVRLEGYSIEPAALRPGGVLTLTTQWQAQAPLSEPYMLFIHLLDEAGNRIAQADVPPAGPEVPTTAWRPGHYYRWFHPLPLPADLPPGDYWLALGLYHPQTFERLPLQAPPPSPAAPDYGADALLLEVRGERPITDDR